MADRETTGKQNGLSVNTSNDRVNQTTPPVTWVPWMVNPSAERLSAYRASGVRVRMRGNVAQVALMDEDDAKAVDVLEEACGR